MKLKHLILISLTAAAAYKVYSHRRQMTQLVEETGAILTEGQESLEQVKEQIQTLQDQLPELNKFSNKLTYKLRVFQEESKPHIQAIQATLAKYQTPDRYWE